MTRLESSAWPLAAGSASVFALAVVLGGLPWPVGFGAVVLAVAAWGWLGPLVTGASLGGVAWLCVTGFDVHHFGEITVTGPADAVRAGVLVSAGLLFAGAHALAERPPTESPDPLWADFHATAPAPAASRTPQKEPSDG
jgi:hypothetical protein